MSNYTASRDLLDQPVRSWVTSGMKERLKAHGKVVEGESFIIRKAVEKMLKEIETKGYSALFEE